MGGVCGVSWMGGVSGMNWMGGVSGECANYSERGKWGRVK